MMDNTLWNKQKNWLRFWWLALFLFGFAWLYYFIEVKFPVLPFKQYVFVAWLTFIVALKYAFHLRFSWFGTKQKLKLLGIGLIPFLIYWIYRNLSYFLIQVDEDSIKPILSKYVSDDSILEWHSFYVNIFLGIHLGAILALLFLFFRLVKSVWRYHNYKKI